MRRRDGGGRRMTEEGKGKIGSSFDDFLKEEGIYEEVSAHAIKRVLARQLDGQNDKPTTEKSEEFHVIPRNKIKR